MIGFKKIRKAIHNLTYFIYPKKCMFCDEVIPIEKSDFTCPHCLMELNFVVDTKEPRIFILEYDEMVRHAILKMKYKNKKHYAEGFAILMADRFRTVSVGEYDLIINVPMHWKKKIKRNYDQAEELAYQFSKIMNIPLERDNLIRTKETVPQSKVSFEERKNNVLGVFDIISKDRISGKNVILVDDIYTSGNTINQCSLALKEAGAENICYLLVAKVEDKSNILI